MRILLLSLILVVTFPHSIGWASNVADGKGLQCETMLSGVHANLKKGTSGILPEQFYWFDGSVFEDIIYVFNDVVSASTEKIADQYKALAHIILWSESGDSMRLSRKTLQIKRVDSDDSYSCTLLPSREKYLEALQQEIQRNQQVYDSETAANQL